MASLNNTTDQPKDHGDMKGSLDITITVQKPKLLSNNSSENNNTNNATLDQTEITSINEHLGDESGKGEQNRTSVTETSSKPKAIDGGYGWFVVLGCFLAHTISGGIDRMEGVFFLQYISRFGESAQLTAWPGAMVSTVRLFFGPIASAVCTRYSVRSSVLVGGLLAAMGCIITGLAPNLYFIFFSHVVVSGIGRGLMYAPNLIIVGMYFNKRRGLAAGLGSAGVGVGTFLLVPLAQYLFEEFGFFGAFLIIGGITLNMLFVAMLYRPLSMHHFFLQSRKSKLRNNSLQADKGCTSPIENEAMVNQELESLNPKSEKIVDNKWEETEFFTGRETEHKSSETSTPKNGKFWKNSLVSSLKICFPIEHKTPSMRSTKKLFHFYLLKNPSFLLYCSSLGLFTMSTKSAFTFIPALVTSKDISASEGALVLSIAGILDTLGRVATGFVFDLPAIVAFRPFVYSLFMFGVAAIAFILPSLTSFSSFCIICGLYGLITGAFLSQKSVIIVDILGASHLSSSFGILICFQGLGNLLGPPLSGALKDYFGTFDEAFYLGGGSLVVAACLMTASNFFLKKQRRKASQETSKSV